jgi:G:T-mismatch repair DNA endonuclease (very short patch repair protein)
MRSTDVKKEEDDEKWPKRFIFYDFESMQESDGTGEHVPNLVVTHSICEMCQDVTLVTPQSTCTSCGSRCTSCCKLNKKRNNFEQSPCSGCGKREVIFSGPQTVERFCEWLLDFQHKNVLAIAHNSKGYDAYFIYNYLIRNSIKPEIIFQGSKITHCLVRSGLNIKLLDSMNFLPMALSRLPGSFGLKELKKGYFPHLYNTPHMQNDSHKIHLSHLPDMKYYDPDHMSISNRKAFLTWYNEYKDKPFDFHHQLLAYCRSDVNILLSACWKFRQLLMDVTGGSQKGVDPFNYITIASVCMGIFRTKFLNETWSVLLPQHADKFCNHQWNCTCKWSVGRKVAGDNPVEVLLDDGLWSSTENVPIVKEKFIKSPIGLIPIHGYARRDNFSMQAMEWIHVFTEYFNRLHDDTVHVTCGSNEKKISYTKNGRQFQFKVDGYFLDKHGHEHVMEFNGCWWHGCPTCYPSDRDKLMVGGKNLKHKYKETLWKQNMLAKMGYEVHTMWSCQFEKEKRENVISQQIAQSCDISEPINIRDCFFGGRTNALQLYKEFQGNVKGHYLDFCSLYPSVLKQNIYPVGHPERITGNFMFPFLTLCTDKFCPYVPHSKYHWKLPYFGLMKVKILPPRKLFHPVLPIKCNGKLMFPLCITCAVNERQSPCTCMDEDRAITHSYCTNELEVALNMGYTLLKIYEVLNWRENSGENSMFSTYINTFLQMKAEASGYPSHVISEVDKKNFIENYARKEGVTLNMDKIEKNPGLRSIAKLALNSFYGKFGQRVNMKKCLFVTHPHQLYQMLTDCSKSIKDFHIINEEMMAIEYTHSEEFQTMDPKTNVIIAAFCTSWARLKLFHVMNTLGKRVLYHDTDSIIYSQSPHEFSPETGEHLGQLTDELACKEIGCTGCETGHWIIEFISCGPKNYAYKLNTGELFCKVRGFSLNFSASHIVNLNSMKEALHCWKNKLTKSDMITVKTMILRNKLQAIVYSKQVPKHYGVVYNKRIVLDNYETVPYGY